MTNKKSENQKKYDNEHTTRISLKLNKKSDKDIIDAIDPGNRQGSIKKLIRRGLEK